MKKTRDLIILAAAVIMLLIMAASVQPQLSFDEKNAIVEAVVQTMNPENMKATLVAEVEADLIAKFNAAGYVGLAGAMSLVTEAEKPQPTATPEPTAVPAEVPAEDEAESAAEESAAEAAPAADASEETISRSSSADTGKRAYDDVKDFYNGAVLQEDGTYRGLHAKQLNAYAYTVGEDEDGVVKQFHTEYTPNVRFNVDVVFINDGSVIWPARIEMRHIGNVGEYTGHTESVIVDRTYDPVKPGDRCGFTISAHGSENLGWTTFYFQLYDADSGSIIEGGQGSFTYHAI